MILVYDTEAVLIVFHYYLILWYVLCDLYFHSHILLVLIMFSYINYSYQLYCLYCVYVREYYDISLTANKSLL